MSDLVDDRNRELNDTRRDRFERESERNAGVQYDGGVHCDRCGHRLEWGGVCSRGCRPSTVLVSSDWEYLNDNDGKTEYIVICRDCGQLKSRREFLAMARVEGMSPCEYCATEK